MPVRVAFPGSSALASGQSVSATNNNKLPGGKIGRVSITANSAGTTTTETITSIAPTIGTSREITVRAVGTLRSSIAGGCSVRVTEDGIQIGRKNGYIAGSAQDWSFNLTFVSVAPSAGAHTYALITGVSGAAGNTVTLIASAETGTEGACRLEVVDDGVSF